MRSIHYSYPLSRTIMKNIFLLPLLLLPVSLSAQAPYPTADEGKIMLNSTTCIVLENSPFSMYNPAIREAVKEAWTITPYEFIDIQEFNNRRSDPSFSFLVLLDTEYEKDKTGSTFAFVNLLLGKKVKNIEEMPEFCAIPIDFAGEDADADYGYKLELVIRFIQQHAQVVVDNPKNSGVRFLKYYNKFVSEVVNKTILAREEDMVSSLKSVEEIKKLYPYPFMIVSEEEIMTAVSEKRPGTLILHKVGPPEELTGAYVFKMLIGTDDARMYYFNNHKVSDKNPNGFLPADISRISRF